MTRSTFVLPQNLELSTESGELCLRHPGDITLEQTLGLPVGQVHSGANLTLSLNATSGQFHADGNITISGNSAAQLEAGGHVRVFGSTSGGLISASGDVSIGGDNGANIQATGEVSVTGTNTGAVQSKHSIYIEGSSSEALHSLGPITVEGDLDSTAHASGKLTVKGALRGSGTTANDAIIQGDLTGALTSGGPAIIQGDLIGEVCCGDALTVQGSFSGSARAEGLITIEGDCTSSLQGGGSISIKGDCSANITSRGDLVINGAFSGKTLQSSATVTLNHSVNARRIIAEHLVFTGGEITAKAIAASQSITIASAKLKVDIIMAPTILIDPSCSGRVTVIESENDRDSTKIKGGFSLEEYEEIIGGAEDFLAARELSPLDQGVNTQLDPLAPVQPVVIPDASSFAAPNTRAEGPSETKPQEQIEAVELTPEPVEAVELTPQPVEAVELTPEPVEAVQSIPENVDVPKNVDAQPDVDPSSYSDSAVEVNDASSGARFVQHGTVKNDLVSFGEEDFEDINDPPSLDVASIEVLDEIGADLVEPLDPNAEIQEKMLSAVGRIVSSYDENEVPPPILTLSSLIKEGEYDELSDRITEFWTALIKYHQKRRIRPPHKVTHAFNIIHGLTQEIL